MRLVPNFGELYLLGISIALILLLMNLHPISRKLASMFTKQKAEENSEGKD